MSFMGSEIVLDSHTFASICNGAQVSTGWMARGMTYHVRSDPCADRQVNLFSDTIPHLLYTFGYIYVIVSAVFRNTATTQ